MTKTVYVTVIGNKKIAKRVRDLKCWAKNRRKMTRFSSRKF
ncbi:hypothetical protein PROSTU_02811 [Providencia stuartii ATCC 25827]|uniref:Uncharacterized protein n=1 Tax=Providencia stuartii ATCC 25827 TaxID=471874 RepID=A0AA86YK11_PROST|nr:hypothetical protein PROSTU_02811 [Providencia stuartii ATCC 25827]